MSLEHRTKIPDKLQPLQFIVSNTVEKRDREKEENKYWRSEESHPILFKKVLIMRKLLNSRLGSGRERKYPTGYSELYSELTWNRESYVSINHIECIIHGSLDRPFSTYQ